MRCRRGNVTRVLCLAFNNDAERDDRIDDSALCNFLNHERNLECAGHFIHGRSEHIGNRSVQTLAGGGN